MDGVLAFFKPPGITSHDAIGICRRILKERKIGHSGTLDPLAYGVLPIFVGKATRLIEYTNDLEKTYVAEGMFGHFTDTEDSSGVPIESMIKVSNYIPTMKDLETVCHKFLGVSQQRPSSYSAIKVNGVRAYELARAGKTVTLPERTITIFNIQLLAYQYPYFTLRVTCSSGTYIRSLLRDIFLQVGIPGTMTQLARTQVGSYKIADTVTAEELMLQTDAALLPVDSCVSFLDTITIDNRELLDLTQGKQLGITKHFAHTQVGRCYRVYSPKGFLGLARRTKDSIKVEKNIFL